MSEIVSHSLIRKSPRIRPPLVVVVVVGVGVLVLMPLLQLSPAAVVLPVSVIIAVVFSLCNGPLLSVDYGQVQCFIMKPPFPVSVFITC